MTILEHLAMIASSAPSSPQHHAASQAIWQAMEAAGDLYLDRYEGWYSVRDEAFYDEKELVDGEGGASSRRRARRSNGPPRRAGSSACRNISSRLLDLYAAHPDFIRPESRRNEVLRFVEGGLSDLSVSRTSFDWGVKVPGSAGPCHVCLGRCADQLSDRRSAIPTMPRRCARYWPADLHLIGKDIVRFHAVYWPAFLMSAKHAAAEAGVRPRLPAQPRREDVEIGRQCRRSDGAGRTLRRRCAALFPAARSQLRPGRQLFAPRRSSRAPMPISPTASAISRSARLSIIAKNCDGGLPRSAAHDRCR